MPQNVKCPGCKQRLRYSYDLEGKPGICPACEHLILPPEGKGEQGGSGDESLREVRSLEDRLDDLKREGKALARENGIRLNDKLDPDFGDKKQVEARQKELKREVETELKSLRIGAVHGMTVALQEEKIAHAASMLCGEKGDDGKAMLYHCPCCHAGYIELTLQFKAKWKEDGNDQSSEESWRVASVPLDEYEVEWFRIFKEEAGDDPTGDSV